ncbi:hypothetical protein CE497_25640 [Salmonella enterica subsp. enterica serovar Typhimurium]|nr:hypothetical protein CE497_25640 [Salmonella enterica subsp. enterica serovar Typhimurium]
MAGGAGARGGGGKRLWLVIPCQRVVRGDGALSGNRWGGRRTAQLLEREALKEEQQCWIYLLMKRPGKSPWRLARWCCAALRFARRSRY